MAQKINDFKELTGKTIARITVTNESDFRSIDIRFADGTEFSIGLSPRVDIKLELVDWKTGDSNILKKYPVIHEDDE